MELRDRLIQWVRHRIISSETGERILLYERKQRKVQLRRLFLGSFPIVLLVVLIWKYAQPQIRTLFALGDLQLVSLDSFGFILIINGVFFLLSRTFEETSFVRWSRLAFFLGSFLIWFYYVFVNPNEGMSLVAMAPLSIGCFVLAWRRLGISFGFCASYLLSCWLLDRFYPGNMILPWQFLFLGPLVLVVLFIQASVLISFIGQLSFIKNGLLGSVRFLSLFKRAGCWLGPFRMAALSSSMVLYLFTFSLLRFELPHEAVTLSQLNTLAMVILIAVWISLIWVEKPVFSKVLSIVLMIEIVALTTRIDLQNWVFVNSGAYTFSIGRIAAISFVALMFAFASQKWIRVQSKGVSLKRLTSLGPLGVVSLILLVSLL